MYLWLFGVLLEKLALGIYSLTSFPIGYNEKETKFSTEQQ